MTARTCVEVATVWTSPDAPRDIDAPATAAVPDLLGWLCEQSAEARRGLHGRTLTQLLEGEPVDVLEEEVAGWARICAPWQPNPADYGGYVGWVRRSHIELADGAAPGGPAGPVPPDRIAVMDAARQFVGVRYLWGGLSPYGLDCSGLVHYAYRQAGRWCRVTPMRRPQLSRQYRSVKSCPATSTSLPEQTDGCITSASSRHRATCCTPRRPVS
ncbi:MAG: SH3 domain-containing C40 family peptidase [Nocardioidaceae bacterium]